METYSYYLRPKHKIIYEVNLTNDTAKFYSVDYSCDCCKGSSQFLKWGIFLDEYSKELKEIPYLEYNRLKENCSRWKNVV